MSAEGSDGCAAVANRVPYLDDPNCNCGYTQCAFKSGDRLAYLVLGGKQSLSSFTNRRFEQRGELQTNCTIELPQ